MPHSGVFNDSQRSTPYGMGPGVDAEQGFVRGSRAPSSDGMAASSRASSVAQPRGCVIIPCYNHADTIATVISDVHAVAPNLPVVVVDDGSNPSVQPIPGVDLVRHSCNMGKGAAILSGINHFHDRDYAVLLDADGQHRAEEIPQLLAAFERPPLADVVTSSRDFVHDGSIPLRHRLANLALSMEFALLHGTFIPDITNGFRILRMRSLLAVDLRFHRFEIDMEMLRVMLRSGLVIRSVPTQGVRYGTPSSFGRGFRITATLVLSMVAARFLSPRLGLSNHWHSALRT